MAPLLSLLFLIIGISATIALATNGYGFEYIWIPWLPSTLLNFVDLYYFINRHRRLSKTIEDWNRWRILLGQISHLRYFFYREVGLGQGVSLKVGLNEKITSYLKFAYMVVNCNCSRQSNIKICRLNKTAVV